MRYFLLFLFLPFLLNAQDYQPMAVEGAQWVIYQDANIDSLKKLYGYVIRGDTVNNGITYKKVFYREYEYNGHPVQPPYNLESEHFFALIRDDTAQQKVYAMGAPYSDECMEPTGEKLWYEFSIVPGDTMADECVYRASVKPNMILDSSAVESHFGYERETYFGYFLDSSGHSATKRQFIVGIGSSRGGLFDYTVGLEFIPGHGIYLEDYCIGSDADCQITTSVQEPNFIEHSISPNPVRDRLSFQFGSDARYPMQITIYNQLGQKVDAREVHAPLLNYNCSDFLSGIYYYTLQHDGQVVGKGRYVKE